MPNDKIEISVKGKWIKVPALDVNGKTIVAQISIPHGMGEPCRHPPH